jgi:outer membrane lipase/esterase
MYYQSILQAPGQVSILAEMPLSLARGHLNGIENHLKAIHATAQRGKYVPFVNSGYARLDVDDTDDTPGYDNGHYNLTAGLSYCFAENLIAGVALGHNTAAVEFDDDRGDFDLDGIFLSLLASYQYSSLILGAVATAGDLDYNDVNRKVRLGPAIRTHKGDTSGNYYAVKMSLQLDLFGKKGFTMGPIVSINYQEVDVDGFHEKSNLSTSMNFHDQERKSLLGIAGMFINYDTQTPFWPLQLYSSIAYEEEFKDDKRYMRAGINTLQGSSFKLPAYEPETSFWSFDLGLNTELVKNCVAAISYHAHKGNDDSIGQGIQLTIQAFF